MNKRWRVLEIFFKFEMMNDFLVDCDTILFSTSSSELSPNLDGWPNLLPHKHGAKMFDILCAY